MAEISNVQKVLIDILADGNYVSDVNGSSGSVNVVGSLNGLTGTLVTFVSRNFPAENLLSPVTSDWAVNALAPTSTDSNNSGLTVRLFDDTTEEGAGFYIRLPTGSTAFTLRLLSRAETAPGATRTVGIKLYAREIPDNAAVTAWQSQVLTDISIPTNENFQYDSQTITFVSWGTDLNAGSLYQFQLTRVNPGAGTELVGDWALLNLEIEITG